MEFETKKNSDKPSHSYVKAKTSNMTTIKVLAYVALAVLGVYFVTALAFLLANMTKSSCVQNNLELETFESVKKALDSGHKIRFLIDNTKMNINSDGTYIGSYGRIIGFDLNEFRFYDTSTPSVKTPFFISSYHKLIYRNVFNYFFVYEFLKVRIYENNSFDFKLHLIDPVTYSLISFQFANGTLGDKSLKVFLKPIDFS